MNPNPPLMRLSRMPPPIPHIGAATHRPVYLLQTGLAAGHGLCLLSRPHPHPSPPLTTREDGGGSSEQVQIRHGSPRLGPGVPSPPPTAWPCVWEETGLPAACQPSLPHLRRRPDRGFALSFQGPRRRCSLTGRCPRCSGRRSDPGAGARQHPRPTLATETPSLLLLLILPPFSTKTHSDTSLLQWFRQRLAVKKSKAEKGPQQRRRC